ncbi:MAG: 30S ribosome-binding factor RbfA [Actinomycetota bacterium]
MPKDFPRADRVERLAREVLGEAISGLKDPRVGFATVTTVRVSPDLRRARAWVSILGGEGEREATMDALRHATPHLRSVLGREVRLRHTPQLEFLEDESVARGARIDELLRGDLRPAAAEAGAEGQGAEGLGSDGLGSDGLGSEGLGSDGKDGA